MRNRTAPLAVLCALFFLLQCFGADAQATQEEQAVIVVGSEAPIAYYGLIWSWDLRSDRWALVDELVDWALEGSPRPRQRRTRILMASHANANRVPSSNSLIGFAPFMLYQHLRLRGMEVHVDDVDAVNGMTAQELRNYDLVMFWQNWPGEVGAIKEAGVPFITRSEEQAATLGLIAADFDGDEVESVEIVSGLDGPYREWQSGNYSVARERGYKNYANFAPVAANGIGVAFAGQQSAGMGEEGLARLPSSRNELANTDERELAIAPAPDAAAIVVADRERPIALTLLPIVDFERETWPLHQTLIDWLASRSERESPGSVAGTAREPSQTKILLFTYDNVFVNGVNSWQRPGFQLFINLLNAGYQLRTESQLELPKISPEEFRDYDLVIYWNRYGHDSSNVLASGVPFLSASIHHGIATGIATPSSTRFLPEVFRIVDPIGAFRGLRQNDWEQDGDAVYTSYWLPSERAITLIGVVAGQPENLQKAIGRFSSAIVMLAPNYPNPFRTSTQLRFRLQQPAQVSARVVDVRGRLVSILQNGWLDSGERQLVWDGSDAAGQPVASGTYWLQLRAGEDVVVRKLSKTR